MKVLFSFCAIALLAAQSAVAQVTFYPDGSAVDASGRYWGPGGYPSPGMVYSAPSLPDARLPTINPDGPYSAGRSLPPLEEPPAPAWGPGPPDRVEALPPLLPGDDDDN